MPSLPQRRGESVSLAIGTAPTLLLLLLLLILLTFIPLLS